MRTEKRLLRMKHYTGRDIHAPLPSVENENVKETALQSRESERIYKSRDLHMAAILL